MADDLDTVTVTAKKERDSGSGSTSGGGGGGRTASSPGNRGGPTRRPPPPPPGDTVPSGDPLQNLIDAAQASDSVVVVGTPPDNTLTLPSGDLLQLGNPRGLLTFGNALTPPFARGTKRYLPGLDRPPSLGAPPGESFVGPEPEKLPEVKVEGSKPPAAPPRTLTPGAIGAFLGGVAGWAFWFLTVPRLANIDERKNTDKALRQRIAEIAAGLQPVVPSIVRLPDPLATVTVSASRLKNRVADRASRGTRVNVAPRMSKGRVGFQPSPNSFLYPKPQKAGKRFPITSEVTFGTSRSLVGQPYASPRPKVAPGIRPKTGVVPGVPLVPGVPGVGVVPTTPIVGTLTPLPSIAPTPATLTQFQPQRVGDCNCVKQKTKPDRKPRKPRTVCHRGTYVEFSNGTSKTVVEEVPCETKAAARAREPKKQRAPRKPKLKPGQFPGMGVF